MIRRIGAVLLALLATACTAPLRPALQPAPSSALSVDGLAAAIADDAKRMDHESDEAKRADLAADAGRDAEACLSKSPQAAACLYGHAVALGLDVRAHPTRAAELLKRMVQELTQAEAADPGYDHAGPARVRALVLLRAPGWPLGPGDPESGLSVARRAVSLEPRYPPNVLALAEGFGKTGDPADARRQYEQARDFAQSWPDEPDRDDWLREAQRGLK